MRDDRQTMHDVNRTQTYIQSPMVDNNLEVYLFPPVRAPGPGEPTNQIAEHVCLRPRHASARSRRAQTASDILCSVVCSGGRSSATSCPRHYSELATI